MDTNPLLLLLVCVTIVLILLLSSGGISLPAGQVTMSDDSSREKKAVVRWDIREHTLIHLALPILVWGGMTHIPLLAYSLAFQYDVTHHVLHGASQGHLLLKSCTCPPIHKSTPYL